MFQPLGLSSVNRVLHVYYPILQLAQFGLELLIVLGFRQ